MRLLIVEDDTVLLSTMVLAIRSWGYSVDTAHTGIDSLQKIRKKFFDMILLDIFLPDSMGHELIPEFKMFRPNIRIITMTGYNSRDLEREVRKQGIIYYMLKPFKNGHLKEILDHTKMMMKTEHLNMEVSRNEKEIARF